MKNKVVLTLLSSLLLSTSVMSAESSKKENQKIEKTKEAIVFGDYVNSRPSERFLFETSTRMINFETKTIEIMDVSKPTPEEEFDRSKFVEVKKFDADFSGIQEVAGLFDQNSYPQKRIEDECTLTIEEYGLYLEGEFINENTFKISKLKPKLIDTMTNYYCKNKSYKSSGADSFVIEEDLLTKENIILKKTATFEIYD